MSDRSNIYVISLVAIVAVVGLVTLFMPGGVSSGELLMDADGNFVGQAFMLPEENLKVTMAPPMLELEKQTKLEPKTSEEPALLEGWRPMADPTPPPEEYVIEMPNECVDTDPGNDLMLPGAIIITLATGEVQRHGDYCGGVNRAAQYTCAGDPTRLRDTIFSSCPVDMYCALGRCGSVGACRETSYGARITLLTGEERDLFDQSPPLTAVYSCFGGKPYCWGLGCPEGTQSPSQESLLLPPEVAAEEEPPIPPEVAAPEESTEPESKEFGK